MDLIIKLTFFIRNEDNLPPNKFLFIYLRKTPNSFHQKLPQNVVKEEDGSSWLADVVIRKYGA